MSKKIVPILVLSLSLISGKAAEHSVENEICATNWPQPPKQDSQSKPDPKKQTQQKSDSKSGGIPKVGPVQSPAEQKKSTASPKSKIPAKQDPAPKPAEPAAVKPAAPAPATSVAPTLKADPAPKPADPEAAPKPAAPATGSTPKATGPTCTCPPDPCCNSNMDCNWKFNPCHPKGCSGMRPGFPYATIDALYWRAENHGYSYAFEQTSADSNIGYVKRVNPRWAPGFRVGLGMNTKNDFWDILLNYTWYHNLSKESNSKTNGYVSLWSQNNTFSSVSSRARLNLGQVDLELGRMFYASKSFLVRPHFGIRGGRLHQKFRSSFSSGATSLADRQLFNGRNNYWGVGPRGGLNGEWRYKEGVGFFGKVSGALLYGKTQSRSLNQIAALASDYSIQQQYTDNFYQLVPNLQMSLGVQWQTCFNCQKMLYKMSAAWETNYWWDQFNLPIGLNGFLNPTPTTGNHPLTMEGLTFSAEMDF